MQHSGRRTCWQPSWKYLVTPYLPFNCSRLQVLNNVAQTFTFRLKHDVQVLYWKFHFLYQLPLAMCYRNDLGLEHFQSRKTELFPICINGACYYSMSFLLLVNQFTLCGNFQSWCPKLYKHISFLTHVHVRVFRKKI